MSQRSQKISTSSFSRLTKLTGIAARVGASVLGNKTVDLFRSQTSRAHHKLLNQVVNAKRVAETLGRLKGGAMKIGQMLSLHESVLPKEVAEILAGLQKNAPAYPFKELEAVIKEDLGANFSQFARIEPEPYAAASIGQVHLAYLTDGRKVAVKIQYPQIDRIIAADLKNIKSIMQTLLSNFMKMDLDPLWEELSQRLTEELDYGAEAQNLQTLAQNYESDESIVIPRAIESLSGKHVLTMECLEGISPRQAWEAPFSQSQRNLWAKNLFRFSHRGLFVHGLLHADPNLANFAFLQDGRIIVYDFGCVKKVSTQMMDLYRGLISAITEDRRTKIPEILERGGFAVHGNERISQELIDDFYTPFAELFADRSYAFSQNRQILTDINRVKTKHLAYLRKIHFPKDILFIDRTLFGHFGNLGFLQGEANWRREIQNILAEENK